MRLTPAQHGLSMVELLVAVAISAIAFKGAESLLLITKDFQRHYEETLESENLRNLVRTRVDCSLKCAEQKERIPAKIGPWEMAVQCDDWYGGFHPTAKNVKTGKVVDVFPLGGGNVCEPRRKSCTESCHNRGLLVDRGFLYPPVSGVYDPITLSQQTALPPRAGCPEGYDVIGVDFALGRLLCDRPASSHGLGLCVEDRYFPSAAHPALVMALGGTTECQDFGQYQVFSAKLEGQLQVAFANGFVPTRFERFEILRSYQRLEGRFNHAGDVLAVGIGNFKIVYTDHSVFLTDFRLQE